MLVGHSRKQDEARVEAIVQADPKFVATTKLRMGQSSESDLNHSIGFHKSKVLSECIADPLAAMHKEWQDHGTDKDFANFIYICHGRARCESDIPTHVRETFRTGKYHGGSISQEDYDAGHDGWDLSGFCALEAAVLADLQGYHVAAIRAYTSDSFSLFNEPMHSRQCPHPIKTTIFFLNDALKKLRPRKVGAKVHPARYNEIVFLWRVMGNITMDLDEFKRHGGTELAAMSTSSSRDIAESYARSARGVVMSFATRGLSRGVDISMFSLYPKEREFLYPPLTYMLFDESRALTEEDSFTVFPILPQMT